MECSICLESLENKKTYKLSCGHEFHTLCYQGCVYNNNCNIFIKCPLCRELNINIEKPYDNTYDNLKCWTKFERCKCKTKSGKRCSNMALPGQNFCTVHQKVEKQDKEVQCSKIKSDGERCKMMIDKPKKRCHYHD